MQLITKEFYSVPIPKIQKRYPEVYNFILDYASKHKIICTNWKQKLYCYINHYTSHPICPQCKINPLPFLTSTHGYKMFCSCKCSANSDYVRSRTKATLLKEGLTNVSQRDDVKQKKRDICMKETGFPTYLQAYDERIKETWRKKYDGADNPSYAQVVKDKISIGVKKSAEPAKIKRKETLLAVHGFDNACYLRKEPNKESEGEKFFRSLLNADKIKLQNREYDIHIPNTKILIECDGSNWHTDKMEKLFHQQASAFVNDFNKDKVAKEEGYELIRVRTELIEKGTVKDLETARANSYQRDYYVAVDTIISTKEYFIKYIIDKGKRELGKKAVVYLRLFRTFFPSRLITDEKIAEKYNDDKILRQIIRKIIGLEDTEPRDLTFKEIIEHLQIPTNQNNNYNLPSQHI